MATARGDSCCSCTPSIFRTYLICALDRVASRWQLPCNRYSAQPSHHSKVPTGDYWPHDYLQQILSDKALCECRCSIHGNRPAPEIWRGLTSQSSRGHFELPRLVRSTMNRPKQNINLKISSDNQQVNIWPAPLFTGLLCCGIDGIQCAMALRLS